MWDALLLTLEGCPDKPVDDDWPAVRKGEELCSSKCSPRTRSISITWALVGDAVSGPLPHTYWIRVSIETRFLGD